MCPFLSGSQSIITTCTQWAIKMCHFIVTYNSYFLMTFKQHRLFMSTARIVHEIKQKQVIGLIGLTASATR